MQRVLKDIGADTVPQLLVFNKLDALEISQIPLQLSDLYEIDGVDMPRIFVSAQTGAGLPQLRAHLAKTVQEAMAAWEQGDNSDYDPRFGIVES